MKIAYIMYHEIWKNDGIVRKIMDQIEEWEKYGIKVSVFCKLEKTGKSILTAKQYLKQHYLFDRIIPNRNMIRDIQEFNPDILYSRYNVFDASLYNLARKYKMITEINSYDLGEMKSLVYSEKSIQSVLRFLAYYFLRSLMLKKVAGMIGVTKELAEKKEFAKYKKPIVYIPNAINISKYNVIKKKSTALKKEKYAANLYFIGSPNIPWHGIEKIQKMAKELPEFHFDIVGIQGASLDNIKYHGYISKDQYMKIMSKAQICIGTMGLEKKSMSEACPLKVREYIAYGFPVIIGYKDTAFIDCADPEWVFRTDQNKSISELRSFIEKYKNYILVKKDRMMVDVSVTEKVRIDFFNKILGNDSAI